MKKYSFEDLVNLAKRSASRVFLYDSSTKEASVILPASDFEKLVGGMTDELSCENNSEDIFPTEFHEDNAATDHWKEDDVEDNQQDDVDMNWESTGDILKNRTPSSQLNDDDEMLHSFVNDIEKKKEKSDNDKSLMLDPEHHEPVPFQEHTDEKGFEKQEPLQTDDPVFYEEPV